MSRIFVTGDTHGEIDLFKLTSRHFELGRELTKNDYVIICGDFGAIWDGAKSDRYLQKWYQEKPWTTLFVDGNHENFDLLNSYPIETWNGGKIHKINDSIYHLMRGQVFTIKGKTFFTMGGAQSQDKYSRKEGKSWWPQELPSNQEYEEGFYNLDNHFNRVNYILTHSAPNTVLDVMGYGYEHDKLSCYLESVVSSVKFDEFFCGHYHIDKDYGKFHCLYNRIIEL